jgi:hypothetical protein
MDADDRCLPRRFERQVGYLDATDTTLVATTVDMIDEAGQPLPIWREDRRYVTADAIRQCLPRNNCLAHPSVMGRASALMQYKYDPMQKEAEDYDLWLRLAANGHSIGKIDEPLLAYRFLQTSLTRKDNLRASERLYRTQSRVCESAMEEGEPQCVCYACRLFRGIEQGEIADQ